MLTDHFYMMQFKIDFKNKYRDYPGMPNGERFLGQMNKCKDGKADKSRNVNVDPIKSVK